ncbi:MAG: porin family protein [Epsilonproteobacteria bacterium]|nr:porin family protein [Campylobacterota bacterium]
MKRSLVVASLLLCVGSSVLVADESRNWFVGGEFGGMRSKSEAKVSGVGSESDHLNSSYESLKFGKYFDFGRIYGFVSHQNKKDDTYSNTFGLGYDYLFKTTTAFTPFVGATLGYTKVKIDDEDIKDMGMDSPKGLTYGLNVGTLYAFNKNLDFEVGARYLKHNNIDEKFNLGPVSAKLEIKDSIQYYIGLNYNF